jgi:hypothetical protein
MPRQGALLGRVIRTENLATERNRLMKAMSLALREMGKKTAYDEESQDLAAFLVLALDAVSESIERSVGPWEKRDYWLKADRFRTDWAWVDTLGAKLRAAIIAQRPDEIALAAAVLADKLKDVKVSARHRLGSPWRGAWKQLTTGVIS